MAEGRPQLYAPRRQHAGHRARRSAATSVVGRPSNLRASGWRARKTCSTCHLPEFGGYLRASDAEVLLQSLLVPYLRVPLLLRSSRNRRGRWPSPTPTLKRVLERSRSSNRASGSPTSRRRSPRSSPRRTAHLHTPCGPAAARALTLARRPPRLGRRHRAERVRARLGPVRALGASLAVLSPVRLAARVAEYAAYALSPAAAGVRGAAAPAARRPVLEKAAAALRGTLEAEALPSCTRGTRGCGAPAATPTPPPSRSTSRSPPARSPTAAAAR